MQLSQYMDEHGLDDAGLAQLVGDCSASGVRKWRKGERSPRAKQMRAIAVLTEGRVTPNDFFGVKEEESDEAAA
jgi:DNA-binding transcriptional regulator YdaS (Cro superfamily)